MISEREEALERRTSCDRGARSLTDRVTKKHNGSGRWIVSAPRSWAQALLGEVRNRANSEPEATAVITAVDVAGGRASHQAGDVVLVIAEHPTAGIDRTGER